MRGLTVECSAYEVQTAEGGLWTQLMLTWHRVGSSELCVRARARVCGVCVLLCNVEGQRLTTDVRRYNTNKTKKKRQPGTSTRLPRPSWCRYVIFQFAEVAYPTSVNLVINGAVAYPLPRP